MERNQSFDTRRRITGIRPPQKIVRLTHPDILPDAPELMLGGEQSQQTLNPTEYLESSIRMWEELLVIMKNRKSEDCELAENKLKKLKAELAELNPRV